MSHQPDKIDTHDYQAPPGTIVEPYRGALEPSATASDSVSSKVSDNSASAMRDHHEAEAVGSGEDNLTRWAIVGQIFGLLAVLVLLFNIVALFGAVRLAPQLRIIFDNIPVILGIAAFIISVVTYNRRQQSVNPEAVRISSIIAFLSSGVIVLGLIMQILNALLHMLKLS